MKEELKKLFSDSVIYGVSGIISSFISIFLIPLYTKVFSPDDYGIISLLLTTSAVLGIFIIFSLDNSAAVWFWDKETDKERKSTFTSWICFLGVMGLLVCILLSLLSIPLSNLYFQSDKYATLFIVLGISLLFSGFQKAANIWCRMLRRPFWALGYSLTVLLVTVGCNIGFVLWFKIGVIGVFYSQVISGVIGFLLLLWLFGSWIDISLFSRHRLKEMLRFALPLVPATLMFWLMNTASIFFLKYFLKNNAEVGLFQVGLSVANVLALFTWGFFQAWSPFAISVSKQENAKRIYSFILELFCVTGFFVAFSLTLAAENILLIFTNTKYLGAKDVIGLFAINIVLQGIPNILGIANSITKNNNSYAIAVALGSILSVIGFITLIPTLGKEGAAIAMVLGSFFISVYLGIKAQGLYPIPYKFTRIIFFIALQVILFGLAKIYLTGPLFIFASIAAIGIVLIGSYLYIAKMNNLTISFSKR